MRNMCIPEARGLKLSCTFWVLWYISLAGGSWRINITVIGLKSFTVVQTVLCLTMIYVRNIPPAIPRMFFLNEAREVNSAIAELRTRATGHVSRCLGLGHSMGQQFGADALGGISMV